jgi:hypothetical protein
MKITVGLSVDAYAVVHLDLPEGTSEEEMVKQAIARFHKGYIEDCSVSHGVAAFLTVGEGESAYVSTVGPLPLR